MKRDEKRLYQKNKISYYCVLVFILLNTVYTITALKNMAINYHIGIFIMTNIILSLFSFLSAVKLKGYSLSWSYISIGIGIFQFLRMFYLPSELYKLKVLLYAVLFIASICAVIGGIVSINRTKKRLQYISKYKISEEFIK